MIDFKDVSKGYGAQTVLQNACFRINEGERVGVVGPNGAGKTTVFSLIVGELTPDSGRVDVRKDARLGYLRQELNPQNVTMSLLEYVESGRADLASAHAEMDTLVNGFHEEDGGKRDYALARLGELQTHVESTGGYELSTRARQTLFGLGFTEEDLSRRFGQFSGGWQMRAELARLLVADPGLLLLDEPSNYLDIPAIEWLQTYLKTFGGTLAMISHDRYLLNSLTTMTLEIANAEATRYAGNYDRYVNERKTRYEQRVAAHKNHERKRAQVERFIERFRAKNTKASQVQSKIKMLERMDEIVIPSAIVSKGRIRLKAPDRSGQEVVRLDNAGLTYDGKRWVLRNINLRIERGEKVALVGRNGFGKTSLLRIIAGQLDATEGRRALGHKVTVGYQSQEFAETMDEEYTVLETVRNAGGEISEHDARSLLGGFGFSGNAVEKKVAILSGGEKVRLAFARLLINPPNFLVLDEPTTHLDVAARESLEDALCAFEGTICLATHDIAFLRRVATITVEMRPPCIERYCGGYDYYCEKTAPVPAVTQKDAVTKQSTGTTDRKAERRERAMQVQDFSRRRRLLEKQANEAEKTADRLTAEQAILITTLREGGKDIDYATTSKRLKEIQKEMDDATRTWDHATNALELLHAER